LSAELLGMRTLALVAAALLSSVALAAEPAAQVLLVRSPDSGAGNWGLLPSALHAVTLVSEREDGRLPADLSPFRLIVLSTNLDVYEPERRRLWEWVNTGGKLVTWFADDRRADRIFWPYDLQLSDEDPPEVTFAQSDHPLLAGLAGKAFRGQAMGGDVPRSWDHTAWQPLATTPRGPAVLLAPYGEGFFLGIQLHVPLTQREELTVPLARNLLTWAAVTTGPPPDPATRPLRDVLLSVARRQVRELLPGAYVRGTQEQVQQAKTASGISWNYPWGVTLYGLLRTSMATGEPESADFVLRHNALVATEYDYLQWQRAAFGRIAHPGGLAQLVRLSSLDDCGSMSSAVTEGILTAGAPRSAETMALLQNVADYISGRQSRLPDGSLCRGRTLWIDDLYMSCPFLARWGTLTGQRRHWDDAAHQVLAFAGRLQDGDGLWFHGWFDREGRSNGYKWGRGNGWALLTEAEVLDQLPPDHPQYAALLAVFRRHVDGLRAVQAPSGMWRQVLDRPELWEETSCTGMFAFSIARGVRRGWLGPEYLPIAQKAVEGLRTHVTWDGSVKDTCVGTGIGRTLEHYRDRPRTVNDGHGPGPVMLSISEVLAATRP
jgi:unsaturated rhamnogalacturonyl hydrolase